jgi:hypothetical protein
VDFFAGGSGTTPSTLIGTATTSPYSATWPNVAGGSYSVMAKATDNLGVSSVSAIVGVSVNRPPSITINSPLDNASYPTGFPVSIVTHAIDVDGTIARIELLVSGAKPIGITSLGACAPPAAYNDYTCTFDSTVLPPNVYTLTARATDNKGAVTLSTPIRMTINSISVVTLTSPVNGASFALPATVNLAANVVKEFGTIAKVDFYDGATLLGTSQAAPYSVSWSNVPLGSHSVTAIATDNLGTKVTSAATTIVVESVSLNILSPGAAATIYDASVIVTGNFGGTTSPSITVNGRPAVVGNGTFAATIPLVEGTNAITAVATVAGVTTTRSIQITATAPRLFITSPLNGATIQDDTVTVYGFAYAPLNAAVFVNGQLAPRTDSWGKFHLNNLPLAPGSNTITVTMISQDGPPLEQKITVTRDGTAAFGMEVTPDSGFGLPFTVKMTITNRNLTPYGFLKIDANGNGYPEYAHQAPATPVLEESFLVTYTEPGRYALNVLVEAPTGRFLYRLERWIDIGTVSDLDVKVRGVFTGMLDHLKVGNVGRALLAISDNVREHYASVFTTLETDLSTIVDQLGSFDDATFNDELVEYSLIRNTPNGSQRFLIYLMRGPDGIWRSEGM